MLNNCWHGIGTQGRTQGGGGGGVAVHPARNPGPPPPPTKPNLKNTDFVYIMISNVLQYLPFSQNQPLKSADE
jgi:hypothetical protein